MVLGPVVSDKIFQNLQLPVKQVYHCQVKISGLIYFQTVWNDYEAYVNCYCKMTSVMALNGLTSFLRLENVINTCL